MTGVGASLSRNPPLCPPSGALEDLGSGEDSVGVSVNPRKSSEGVGSVKREKVVVATKVNGNMGSDPNAAGNSWRWLIAERERSQRRLGTDYIDLYQVHQHDPNCDIDDTLSALSDLVHSGKIRYFGARTSSLHKSSRLNGRRRERIGSRTIEQVETQLDAPDIRLDPAVLERIDEVVPPGTNSYGINAGVTPPTVTDRFAVRRRPR